MSILLNDRSYLFWNDGTPIQWNVPLASVVISKCAGGGHSTIVADYDRKTQRFSCDYDDLLAPSPSNETLNNLNVCHATLLYDCRAAISAAAAQTWAEVKTAVEAKPYAILEEE
jgi:hypothetical protein